MSNYDREKQSREFKRLRDEFERLNRLFDDAKERAGLPRDEPVKISPDKLSPEAAQALEAAKERARAAGRAAAARSDLSGSASTFAPRRSRRGALAI